MKAFFASLLILLQQIIPTSHGFLLPPFALQRHRIVQQLSSTTDTMPPVVTESSTESSAEATSDTKTTFKPRSRRPRNETNSGPPKARWDPTTASRERFPSVYIGNLPENSSKNELRALFLDICGSAMQGFNLPRDPTTDKFRQYGYVYFFNETGLQECFPKLQGLTYRNMTLRFDIDAEYKAKIGSGAGKVSSEKTLKRQRFDDCTIFVGSLNEKTTQEALQAALESQIGAKGDIVSVRMSRYPDNDELNKGFAHVEFVSQEKAEAALEVLINGIRLDDRTLFFDLAANPDKKNKRVKMLQRREDSKVLFLGNLNYQMNENILEEMLGDVVGPGTYTDINMVRDPEQYNRPKGYAYVEFVNQQTADEAKEKLTNLQVLGRNLRVEKVANYRRANTGDNNNNNNGEEFEQN